MYRLAPVLLMALSFCLFGGGVALAGGPMMIVDETADELNNDGDCSLREAMKAARENVAVDACPPGHPAGTDTIVLTGGLVYNLTIVGDGDDEGDLDAGFGSGPLVLQRSGLANAAIDANGIDRVLDIHGGDVTITSIDFTGGNAELQGGGILARGGTLNLINSVVTNNTTSSFGGGIAGGVGSTLVIERLVATGNSSGLGGGGISSATSLILTRSMINDNEALANVGGGGLTITGTALIEHTEIVGNNSLTFAGGIEAAADDLTINESLIANNTAASFAGGLSNGGTTDTSTATLRNVTVSGNTSNGQGGGIRNESGDVVNLLNVTLTGNDNSGGGGDSLSGLGIEATNTIIDTESGSACSSPVTSHGHNIDSGDSCGLDADGDMTNTDPLLGPLQDNGGPNDTHALLANSPAIDAADDDECPDIDQRGEPRPDGNGCDIGAFESPFTGPTPSPTPAPPEFDWGDINCDGNIDLDDFELLMHYSADLVGGQQLAPCPDIGEPVGAELWGDVNCDGFVDILDALYVLAFIAGVPLPTPGGCTAVGDSLV